MFAAVGRCCVDVGSLWGSASIAFLRFVGLPQVLMTFKGAYAIKKTYLAERRHHKSWIIKELTPILRLQARKLNLSSDESVWDLLMCLDMPVSACVCI
jgi:hypothetical protein